MVRGMPPCIVKLVAKSLAMVLTPYLLASVTPAPSSVHQPSQRAPAPIDARNLSSSGLSAAELGSSHKAAAPSAVAYSRTAARLSGLSPIATRWSRFGQY
jgi:hypothetical protein